MKEHLPSPKRLFFGKKEVGFALKCLVLLVLYQSGCLRQSLDPLPFFEVYTRPLSGKLEKLILRGEVDGLEGRVPDAVGFLYGNALDGIQGADPIGQVIGARLLDGGNFEAEFEGAKPQEALFFRAFVQIGERTVYGNVLTYRLGDIVSMGAATISNDSAVLHGSLIGLQITGDAALEHGHVYSRTNTAPELGLPDCFSTNLGSKDIDYSFQSRVGNLNFNTTYTVRAYAKGTTRTFYSPPATFHVLDGWKRMPDVQDYQEALAAVGHNKAYIGFGCDATSTCLQGSLSNDFWEFSPMDSGGVWNNSTPFDPFFARTKASTFTIGDTLYVLMGEYFDNTVGGSEPFFVFDFLKFNLIDKTWSEGEASDIPKRSGAVAFALNGKGYVGAGEGSDGTRTIPFNDFWQYAPQTGAWRPVANLPLRTPDSEAAGFKDGRADAVAFSMDGSSAYVGSGRLGFVSLKDFWRFDPPSTAEAADMGRWTFVGFFPGLARYSSVAFSVGNKAYFGLGYNLTEGALDDFWEFDPATDKWRKRTAFPGGPRYKAVGFSIGSFGYAGTGLQKRVSPIGAFAFNETYKDLWRYEPER